MLNFTGVLYGTVQYPRFIFYVEIGVMLSHKNQTALSTAKWGLVVDVRMIMLGFSIVQAGLSLKSHDPPKSANGFLALEGVVLITFAKEILTLITV